MGKILFFGRLSGLSAEPPAATTDSDIFRAALADRMPELADPSVRMAVNQEMIQGAVAVGPDDEIAFLPPMSGG
ncbi:MoaD/ThiS family protein [Sphingomicrobium sp. XHP0235]|uniref:MoaD/ThiS family protein n=1 Tax=Sphingomicrobium aquimarinum TaxID=3133971 RepID=UPI0031FF1625